MQRIVYPEEVKEYIARNAEGMTYDQMVNKLHELFNFDVTNNQLRWHYQHRRIRCGKHCGRIFDKDIKEYIIAVYEGKHYSDLAAMVSQKFNIEVTYKQIKGLLGRYKLRTGARKGLEKGDTLLYTKEQVQWIKDNQYGISRAELAVKFNEHFSANTTAGKMKCFCERNHLKNGRSGRFEKGGVSFNKGRKGWYPEGCQKGWFKKGSKPMCYLPIGTERYIERTGWKVKVADPHTWKLKGQLIWEQNNGPIPKGYVVSYKDGNNQNCVIDNLILVTRDQQAFRARHQLYSADKDANMLGIELAQLSSKLHKVQRKIKEKNEGNN